MDTGIDGWCAFWGPFSEFPSLRFFPPADDLEAPADDLEAVSAPSPSYLRLPPALVSDGVELCRLAPFDAPVDDICGCTVPLTTSQVTGRVACALRPTKPGLHKRHAVLLRSIPLSRFWAFPGARVEP